MKLLLLLIVALLCTTSFADEVPSFQEIGFGSQLIAVKDIVIREDNYKVALGKKCALWPSLNGIDLVIKKGAILNVDENGSSYFTVPAGDFVPVERMRSDTLLISNFPIDSISCTHSADSDFTLEDFKADVKDSFNVVLPPLSSIGR